MCAYILTWESWQETMKIMTLLSILFSEAEIDKILDRLPSNASSWPQLPANPGVCHPMGALLSILQWWLCRHQRTDFQDGTRAVLKEQGSVSQHPLAPLLWQMSSPASPWQCYLQSAWGKSSLIGRSPSFIPWKLSSSQATLPHSHNYVTAWLPSRQVQWSQSRCTFAVAIIAKENWA